MASLSNLNDKQNMLLTQLSYESDVLKDNYNGMTLEEIATVIPDEGTQKELQALCDAGLGSLRIKDVDNDSVTGFGAIAFADESGNTGFSFRGTDGISWESLNDWGDNIAAMVTGTSAQSVQAESFFDANRDSSGNNYLYGHSKGGELSESVYANNYSDINGVHLLNPQPLNPYALTQDQLAAMQSNKVDIVVVEGDYVWFLGRLPSYGNVRIAEGNGKNAHLYDSIADMYDVDGNITQGSQPWWEYAVYYGLILPVTTGLQAFGGAIGFVYNCVVRVVDFVKNDFLPAAKEFIDWVADGLKKFGDGCKEFVDGLKSFLTDTANKVGAIFSWSGESIAEYRDFSKAALDTMVAAAKETEEEDWWNITRWDCWYRLDSLVGGPVMNAQYLAGDVDTYYRKLIDMNDASVADVEAIFEKVYNTDDQYAAAIEKCSSNLESQVNAKLRELAAGINVSASGGGR